MSIIMFAIFFISLFIILPIAFAIKKYNSLRKLALVALLIPIVAIGAATNFIYNLFYVTSPESINISLSEEDNRLTINGQWNKKFERYNLGKDFIAISLDEDTYLVNTDMVEYKIEDQTDTYLYKELSEVLKKNPNYDTAKKTLLYEIELEKFFTYFFETNKKVSQDNLIVQYIHIYYPPMDHFLYWVKTVNGKIEDPLNMYR